MIGDGHERDPANMTTFLRGGLPASVRAGPSSRCIGQHVADTDRQNCPFLVDAALRYSIHGTPVPGRIRGATARSVGVTVSDPRGRPAPTTTLPILAGVLLAAVSPDEAATRSHPRGQAAPYATTRTQESAQLPLAILRHSVCARQRIVNPARSCNTRPRPQSRVALTPERRVARR